MPTINDDFKNKANEAVEQAWRNDHSHGDSPGNPHADHSDTAAAHLDVAHADHGDGSDHSDSHTDHGDAHADSHSDHTHQETGWEAFRSWLDPTKKLPEDMVTGSYGQTLGFKLDTIIGNGSKFVVGPDLKVMTDLKSFLASIPLLPKLLEFLPLLQDVKVGENHTDAGRETKESTLKPIELGGWGDSKWLWGSATNFQYGMKTDVKRGGETKHSRTSWIEDASKITKKMKEGQYHADRAHQDGNHHDTRPVPDDTHHPSHQDQTEQIPGHDDARGGHADHTIEAHDDVVQRNGHTDEVHVPRSHVDETNFVPHVDRPAPNNGNNRPAHGDTQGGQLHGDSHHTDTTHGDVHSDKVHSDHGDPLPHQDKAKDDHWDRNHQDNHHGDDGTTPEHTDHADVPDPGGGGHGDHADSNSHVDRHQDSGGGPDHKDYNPHNDHSDHADGNAHLDAGTKPTPHQDSPHGDAPPHRDVAHSDTGDKIPWPPEPPEEESDLEKNTKSEARKHQDTPHQDRSEVKVDHQDVPEQKRDGIHTHGDHHDENARPKDVNEHGDVVHIDVSHVDQLHVDQPHADKAHADAAEVEEPKDNSLLGNKANEIVGKVTSYTTAILNVAMLGLEGKELFHQRRELVAEFKKVPLSTRVLQAIDLAIMIVISLLGGFIMLTTWTVAATMAVSYKSYKTSGYSGPKQVPFFLTNNLQNGLVNTCLTLVLMLENLGSNLVEIALFIKYAWQEKSLFAAQAAATGTAREKGDWIKYSIQAALQVIGFLTTTLGVIDQIKTITDSLDDMWKQKKKDDANAKHSDTSHH